MLFVVAKRPFVQHEHRDNGLFLKESEQLSSENEAHCKVTDCSKGSMILTVKKQSAALLEPSTQRNIP
jgi:hypothetical protein